MPEAFRIVLGQLNQSVGDVGANAEAILAARREARDADLVVFPELHLIGNPPEDLVLRPALVERAAAELERLAEASGEEGPAMLVGSVFVRDGALHNGVALLDQGRVAAVRFKHELPNYGPFDELRLFQPGPLPEPVILRGTMIGVPICEDIWHPEVCRHLADFGTEIFLCINGSPYEIRKETLRIEGVARRRAADTGIPLAYLNRVGGQDELVFDGGSFVVNGDGRLAVQAREWEEQLIRTQWTRTARGWRCDRGTREDRAEPIEGMYCAMVLALRDYVDRNGFESVVVGLGGGLGAALCAAIAVDALGVERVAGALVEPQVHEEGAARDARLCARSLGIVCRGISLNTRIAGAMEAIDACFVGGDREMAARLHARVQAMVLIAFAQSSRAMLVSSANKTDIALGNAAACADFAGDLAPLGDVYEGQVEALARWRNAHVPRIGLGPEGEVVPEGLFGRPYAGDAGQSGGRAYDGMLAGLVDQDKSIDQLVADGFDRGELGRVADRLHRAEGQRRRGPMRVKLSSRSFGRDRRYPVTHAFRG